MRHRMQPITLAPADQAGSPPAPLDQEEARRRAEFSRRVAASLGHIVGVLMRSPSHQHTTLTDLETQVLPALTAGQFRIAEAVSKQTGFLAPVGMVLWAFVSDEVDKRISAAPEQPIRLRPEEWKSGDIAWLVEAVGDPRALVGLIEHVKANELKDRPVKMRIRGQDGKMAIGRVEVGAAKPTSMPPQ